MYLYSEANMMAHGNTIVVYSQEQFDELLVLPNSISGWFDPTKALGVVKFPSVSQAAEAFRRMS